MNFEFYYKNYCTPEELPFLRLLRKKSKSPGAASGKPGVSPRATATPLPGLRAVEVVQFLDSRRKASLPSVRLVEVATQFLDESTLRLWAQHLGEYLGQLKNSLNSRLIQSEFKLNHSNGFEFKTGGTQKCTTQQHGGCSGSHPRRSRRWGRRPR